jgi:hypothetical protein
VYGLSANGVAGKGTERAEIEPRMTTLRKLARTLKVDPAELVGD